MYSQERVNWWRERTLDPAHQQAYNRVAEKVPKKGGRFLDIGCGTGEVLKRIWNDTKYQFYIGIDATKEMIDLAQENLRDSGISPQVVVRVGHSIPKHSKKMLLMKDNFLDSKIPLNYADTSTLTFPEVLTEIRDSQMNKFGPNEWAFLREAVYRGLVRRTKIGGRVISMVYDVDYKNPEKEKNHLDDVVNAAFLFRGLKLESHKFFESQDVWGDTEGQLRLGEIPGYRIFVSTRIK